MKYFKLSDTSAVQGLAFYNGISEARTDRSPKSPRHLRSSYGHTIK
jgi:hypothetical protein